jgi:nucleoside recognition membrane protein YjiH
MLIMFFIVMFCVIALAIVYINLDDEKRDIKRRYNLSEQEWCFFSAVCHILSPLLFSGLIVFLVGYFLYSLPTIIYKICGAIYTLLKIGRDTFRKFFPKKEKPPKEKQVKVRLPHARVVNK